jgi:hypothetical protein
MRARQACEFPGQNRGKTTPSGSDPRALESSLPAVQNPSVLEGNHSGDEGQRDSPEFPSYPANGRRRPRDTPPESGFVFRADEAFASYDMRRATHAAMVREAAATGTGLTLLLRAT